MPLTTNIILTVAAFIFSLVVCYLAIPTIVKIAKKWNLFEKHNNRSVHKHKIPSLGGMAIFMAFTISFLLFSNGYFQKEIRCIIAALLIMFAVGVKDDLSDISPLQKIVGQIIAGIFVVVIGDMRITNVYGFLGFYEINYIASICITLFSIMVISNALNIIDGIDGLASGISALITLVFGTWFFLTKNYGFAIIAASLLGALLIFFRFNVFGKKNKIFMGDTGSLVLGLIIAILVIGFNELNVNDKSRYAVNTASAAASGILIVPFFDMIRVMLIRVIRKRSPWKPDKNHVHHRLLTLGFTHLRATIAIILVNIFLIAVTFILQSLNTDIHLFLLILVLLGIFFSWIPSYLIKKKIRKKKVKKQAYKPDSVLQSH